VGAQFSGIRPRNRSETTSKIGELEEATEGSIKRPEITSKAEFENDDGDIIGKESDSRDAFSETRPL
jgi:hypothetical protein